MELVAALLLCGAFVCVVIVSLAWIARMSPPEEDAYWLNENGDPRIFF